MKNIKNIFKNLFFGLILFILSFVLLWWNEGNSARNIATALYMDKNAIQIESDSIQEANNGLLVALTGSATTESTLQDENVKLPETLVLKRKVEMYQWQEEQNKDSNGNTTYKYSKKWSTMKIDSDSFHDKKYYNPDFPLDTKSFYADSAKLGVFDLTSEQIQKIVPEKELYDLPQNNKYSIENGKYFSGKDIKELNVGDILISYSYAPSKTNISLIGKQQSNVITPFSYKSRNNYVQYNGSMNKEEIIEKYKTENFVLTMSLRFLGWFLMFIGLKLLMSPIEAIFGFVPLLGKIADGISSFIVLLISLILTFVTIALAWFAYRPVISVILIAVSVAIAVIIKRKLPKKTDDTDS